MAGYVIIGNSAAGLAAAKTIRTLDQARDIAVLSMEEKIYSRCMLHKLLGKKRSLSSLEFEGMEFFRENKIRWLPGKEVIRVDEVGKCLILEDGGELPYEKLLIASGAEYFVPPIPNFREAENVIGFRSLSDLCFIEQELSSLRKRAVIIGGGILGLDVACGLLDRGVTVTILEKEKHLMPLQTDEYAAALYEEAFQKAGCKIITGIAVKDSHMTGEDMIDAVILEDGTEIACDFVVVATSVKPQMKFLSETSIQAHYLNYHIQNVLSRFLRKNEVQVNKGLEVNEYMETSTPDIYGAGDVTGLSGIWPDARLMGEIAAKNMCGIPTRRPERFEDKNAVNFFGVTMISLGKVNADPIVYQILVHHQPGCYKRLVLREGYLEGALLVGDLSNAGIYQYLIQNHKSIEGLEKRLFKLSFADWYGIDEETGEFLYH